MRHCSIERVLTTEAGLVARDRVVDEPFVGLLPGAEDLVVVDLQVDLLGHHPLAGRLGLKMHRDAVVLAESEAQVVRVGQRRAGLLEEQPGRSLELDHRFERGARERLSGADEERNTRPAPRVDPEPERDERLGVGASMDSILVDVSAILPAHRL